LILIKITLFIYQNTMNNNSCLMIAVLAIIAIFICYYCNSSSFKATFGGGQPEAAKWAHNMGMMGYGDSANNIQQDLYEDRMWGAAPAPIPSHPASGPPRHYAPGNQDQEIKVLERTMQKEFGIKPGAWRHNDITNANISY
jgi:hypothetical protein